MKSLDDIGLIHGADKNSATHDYLSRYEPFFRSLRKLSMSLLEIGIDGGNSLRVWRDYFVNGEIVGLDHNAEACKHDLGERVTQINGEATSKELWGYLKSKACHFDVIIDDGGHFSHQIIPAFECAWPLLNPGGIYIVEDTHAQYANEGGEKSSLWLWLMALVHRCNEHGEGQCGKRVKRDIESIQIFKSLVIIKKSP